MHILRNGHKTPKIVLNFRLNIFLSMNIIGIKRGVQSVCVIDSKGDLIRCIIEMGSVSLIMISLISGRHAKDMGLFLQESRGLFL